MRCFSRCLLQLHLLGHEEVHNQCSSKTLLHQCWTVKHFLQYVGYDVIHEWSIEIVYEDFIFHYVLACVLTV